ncbi:MAG TPA: multidrug effflux MFS transporter [Pseudomonadales bacterium]|nr:multidrug effflux MFS transporter [Pseudomonadales bacterium]
MTRTIDPAAVPPHWLIAILAAVTATGPFAMQCFLPALPAIQRGFAVSSATAQLTLSASMVAIAVGTLAYGPLSDRYGRRPVLLVGLIVFVVGGFACAFAPNVETLIVARIVQAGGGAAGMVIARAVARDLYGPQRAAGVIARLTTVMVVAPMVAPAIGGFIADAFGWRAIFALVCTAGAVVVGAVVVMFAESHRPEHRIDSPATMLRGFAQLLGSSRFVVLALYPAFSSTIFFSFISGAPYVMVDLLHRPATEYGLYFVLVAGGFMIGNFTAIRLSERFESLTLMTAGMMVALAGVLTTVAFALSGRLDPATLFLPMMLAQFGQGIGLPNAQAEVINVFPLRAGTASALTSFSQMMFAAVASQMLGVLQNGTPWPLLLSMLFGVTGALTAVGLARSMRSEQGLRDAVQ